MNQKSVFEAWMHIVEFVKFRFCIQVIITVHINKLVSDTLCSLSLVSCKQMGN